MYMYVIPIAQDFLLKHSLFFGLVLTIIWQDLLLERGNNHTAPVGQGLCTHINIKYLPLFKTVNGELTNLLGKRKYTAGLNDR